MKFYNKCFLCIIISFLSLRADSKVITYDTDDWHIDRTLSFDSGYIFSLVHAGDDGVHALETNRALADFGVELLQAHGFLYDQLAHTSLFEESALFRGALLKFDFLLNAYLSMTYLVAYHEQGHSARVSSRGLGGASFDGPNNFFGYWISRFKEPFSGATYFSEVGMTLDDSIIIDGAGLNNEMRFSGQLADQMYFNKGHVTDWTPYVLGKLSSLTYGRGDEEGNDLSSILSSYGVKHYDISREDIDAGNILSLALSASTWRYGFGILQYLGINQTRLEAWEIYGVRLPDLEMYLNKRGLSYKIKSGYRVDSNFVIPFAVEFIAKGDTQLEATLGIRKRFKALPMWSFGADVRVGEGIGSCLHVAMRPHEHFQFMVGMEQYHEKTLHGERNMPTFKPRTIGYEAWGKLSLVY